MKPKYGEYHKRDGPAPYIIESNLKIVRENRSKAEDSLRFWERQHDQEMIEKYRKDISEYNRAERELERQLHIQEKEHSYENIRCPPGFIWVGKYHTNKGYVNGHCRKKVK